MNQANQGFLSGGDGIGRGTNIYLPGGFSQTYTVHLKTDES